MLAVVTTKPTECACSTSANVCSSSKTLALLADFVENASDPSKKAGGKKVLPSSNAAPNVTAVVKQAARELGCKSERCVVDHPLLVSFVEEVHGQKAANALKLEARTRFKPPGPRDSTELLSNYDIDGVLSRWAGEPQFSDFFNCPFSMMDFEREDYLFGRVSMADVLRGAAHQTIVPPDVGEPRQVRRACRTFACVLNTDSSSGPGKHWVCAFVDMRPSDTWTVEYFNSAGNSPPRAMTRWLARTCDALIENRREEQPNAPASELARAVTVTSVTHQKSKTECGPYTLFYIRSRLEGVPWTKFTEQRVTDREMVEFRRHLFSGKD